MYPFVQTLRKLLPNCTISPYSVSFTFGDAYRHHQQSDRNAVKYAWNCARVHDISMAMVAGSISRGGRRNALFAIDVKLARWSPARDCLSGLSAQT